MAVITLPFSSLATTRRAPTAPELQNGIGCGAFDLELYNELFYLSTIRGWLTVLGVSNAPPSSPAINNFYLIGSSPTGMWATHANKIALWDGNDWITSEPPLGYIISDNSKADSDPLRYLKLSGAGWVSWAATDSSYGVAREATADEVAARSGLGYLTATDLADIYNQIEASKSPVGAVSFFTTITPPTGWLKANGAAVSRTAYANLFNRLVTSAGFTPKSCTISIASPAVITCAGHGYKGYERIRFSSTGSLPTGISPNVDYLVAPLVGDTATPIPANSFTITTLAGVDVNTSGTQSGDHSFIQSYFGLGDGSTTFNLPDLRGEFLRGFDDGRGADLNRVFGAWQLATAFLGDGDALNIPIPSLNDRRSWTYLGIEADTAPENTKTVLFNFTEGLGFGNLGSTGVHSFGTAANGIDWARTRPRNVALLPCIKF